MPAPRPTRLFHITAIANLAGICQSGALLAKNAGAAAGIAYQNIAHQGAQGARVARMVPNPPGGLVHDYVPFYFAPRSPMLMAINGGHVLGCDWRQADIVHFETTVESVVNRRRFVFYDRNATLAYSTPYTDLRYLDTAVAWPLFLEAPRLDGFCAYWHNKPQQQGYADRMERRQAEFLVHNDVPLDRILRLGVADVAKQALVARILAAGGVKLSVQVMSDWYY